MTIYHTSPRTGGTARCRAIGACPYGATYGTSMLKDGTTAFGTASPTWRDMEELPKGRNEERIVVDADGKVKNVWNVENRTLREASLIQQPTSSTNTAAETVEDETPTVDNEVSRLYQKEEDPDRTYEMRGVKELGIEKLHMDNGYLSDEHMKIVDEADQQGTGIARTYQYGTKKGIGKRFITMKDPNNYNGVFYGHDYSYTDILLDYGSGEDIFALNNYEQADAESTSIAKQYTAEINRRTFSNPTQEQYDNWFSGKTNENTFTIYTKPLSENTVKKSLMNEWIQLQQSNGDDDMYTEEQMTWWKPGSWDEKWPGTA